MMRKVLITGGAGFIGSSLALRLVGRGHSVRVLDSLEPQIHGSNPESSLLVQRIRSAVDFRRGSVTSRPDMLASLDGIDTVVHLAAETGTGQSMYAIQHYSDVNVGGTAMLLDVIANERLPVQRVVVASSRAVYGEGAYCCAGHGAVYPPPRSAAAMTAGDFDVRCPVCGEVATAIATPETAQVVPHSVYGVTKLTQEQITLAVARALGISGIAFRYQNVYGPGQSLSNPYTGILSIFSTRIRNGKSVNIFEDGLESRDFVYIDDVVSATVRGIEHPDVVVDAFNVGAGVATSVSDIARMLQRALGSEVPMEVTGQFRVGDIRHNTADLTKVRAQLGFEPHVSISDGLARFVDWVRGEAVQSDRSDASLAELRTRGLLK